MKKRYTVLVYASGYNELEPEVVYGFLNAEKVGSTPNVNVVYQLSRENRKLVKTMRPNEFFYDVDSNWQGVRRYYVEQKKYGDPPFNFVSKHLGGITYPSMANPNSLYDFIVWAAEKFPSDKLILVISGHSILYTGTMLDYSGDLPEFMGLPNFSYAINRACKKMKRKINALVLDICFMNCLELFYELNYDKENIKNILTYTQDGPIVGMPIDRLIKILTTDHNQTSFLDKLEQFIDQSQSNIVLYQCPPSKLKNIIDSLNQIQADLPKDFPSIDLFKNPPHSIKGKLHLLKSEIKKLAVYKSPMISSKDSLINSVFHLNPMYINEIIPYYETLKFARDTLLVNNLGMKYQKPKNLSKSQILPITGIYRLIQVMNPGKSKKELDQIFISLLKLKKWHQYM